MWLFKKKRHLWFEFHTHVWFTFQANLQDEYMQAIKANKIKAHLRVALGKLLLNEISFAENISLQGSVGVQIDE